MNQPEPNTTLIDGARNYYERFAREAATERPGTPWPAFDDLAGEQSRAWMLCYAANIELAVRIGDAMAALDLGAETA